MPVVTTDPMERFVRLADLMWSTANRSARAWRMGEWALLCQVRADGSSKPRDPSRFAPDRGSSLALDDSGFLPQLGTNLVSSTARFPVMSAAESLVGASQAYAAAIQQRRTSNLSTGTLCRSAIENAAKTIWLLGGDSREVRRARCLGYTEREIGYQRQYIEIEEKFFAVRDDDGKAADYRIFKETERKYKTRLNLLTSLPSAARTKPEKRYEFFVEWAGKWIDNNLPPHIINTNGLRHGMSIGAQRFYAVGSSFVHGYKWMSEYIGSDEDVMAQISDSLGAALIMTECAVALYEAQATHPARSVVRSKNYPDYLNATVAAWRPLYAHPSPAFAEPFAI